MRRFAGRDRAQDTDDPEDLEDTEDLEDANQGPGRDRLRRTDRVRINRGAGNADRPRHTGTPDQGNDPENVKPSRMRPPEAGWGYVVAAVLAISALIVLTSPGVGGRARPEGYELAYGGFAAALAAVGLIRLGNRVVLVADIFLANILISYVQLPKSLTLVHDAGLIVPLVYAFWVLWFRYRADQKKFLAARSRQRASAARTGPASSPSRGRAKKEPKILPSGRPAPSASGRYTPPSGKRSERRA